jgi:hypothetical protein
MSCGSINQTKQYQAGPSQVITISCDLSLPLSILWLEVLVFCQLV